PFVFSSRRRHTRFSRDWSSDVCSSDLSARRSSTPPAADHGGPPLHRRPSLRWRSIELNVRLRRTAAAVGLLVAALAPAACSDLQIGRASCRERVESSVCGGYSTNKRSA